MCALHHVIEVAHSLYSSTSIPIFLRLLIALLYMVHPCGIQPANDASSADVFLVGEGLYYNSKPRQPLHQVAE